MEEIIGILIGKRYSDYYYEKDKFMFLNKKSVKIDINLGLSFELTVFSAKFTNCLRFEK